jgi:hypothetical protein
LVSENGVEDGEEFACDGDDCDRFRLSGRDEAIEEGFQERIITGRDHGAEEQCAAHAAPAASMKLLPRHCPDWRVQGARPASAAICLRPSRPSSGISAIKVRAITGPMLADPDLPDTENS